MEALQRRHRPIDRREGRVLGRIERRGPGGHVRNRPRPEGEAFDGLDALASRDRGRRVFGLASS
jgi:hypothetical protein